MSNFLSTGGGVSATSTDKSEYDKNYQHFSGVIDNARTKAESGGLQGEQKAEFINSAVTADFNNQVKEATGTTHFGAGAYKQVVDSGVDASAEMMTSSQQSTNYERPRQPGEPTGNSDSQPSPLREEKYNEGLKKFEGFLKQGDGE